MNRATMIASTALVWVAAAGAAVGLAMVVRRPEPAHVVIDAVATSRPVLVEIPSESVESTIVMPTLELRARPRVASRPAVVKPPPKPLHCSEWRALEQGVGSVQVCD